MVLGIDNWTRVWGTGPQRGYEYESDPSCAPAPSQHDINAPYGSFRKIRGTLYWGPYNKDPTT